MWIISKRELDLNFEFILPIIISWTKEIYVNLR